MIPEKPLESLAPCLVGCDGKPLVRTRLVEDQALENGPPEEELLHEDDADMSLLPQNVSGPRPLTSGTPPAPERSLSRSS